jgi:hypothetical protein
MMIRRRGWVLALVGAAAICLSACAGSGSSTAAGPASSAASPTSSHAAIQQVAKFAQDITQLQIDYATATQQYKQALESKDVATSIKSAEKLGAICAADARVAPSGDSVIDTEWPQFASECQTGWALMVQAYQKKDVALIARAHSFFDEATAHGVAAGKRLVALGQQAAQ